jgi:hypothetical protein
MFIHGMYRVKQYQFVHVILGLDSLLYILLFREVVGLEWGLLSLLSKTEELLGRNSSSSGLQNQEYGCRDQLC